MKDQEQSWKEYSAGWAKYLGWAVVRWTVLLLTGGSLRHESGLEGLG